MTFVSTTPFYPQASVQRGAWRTELTIEFCPAFFKNAPGTPEIRPQLRKLQKGLRALEGQMRRGEISVQVFIDANAALTYVFAVVMSLVCEGDALGRNSNPNPSPDPKFESLVKSSGHAIALEELGRQLDATLASGAPLGWGSPTKPAPAAPAAPADAAAAAGGDAP